MQDLDLSMIFGHFINHNGYKQFSKHTWLKSNHFFAEYSICLYLDH